MRIKSSLYSEGEVYTALFTGEDFRIADIDFSVKKQRLAMNTNFLLFRTGISL